MKLSDKACKAAKAHESPKKTPIKLSDGGGLQLWVMPSGAKYWRYKYRIQGKGRLIEKVLALGVYPEVSLVEAREKHRTARKLLAMGSDPALVKKEGIAALKTNNENTFEAVAEEWMEKRKWEIKEKTVIGTKYRLEKDVFPEIGHIPIKDITPTILLAMLKKIENRGAYEMTARARQYCGQILRYAIATGRAERDYTLDIGDALRTRKIKHQPALQPNELHEFLNALYKNEGRLYLQTRMALEMLMLTFVRPIELASAEWDEFYLEEKRWLIPASKTKMNKDHIVPLATQSIAILKRLKELNGKRNYVFVNQNDPNKHMSRDALSKAVRNLGFQGRHTAHGFRALALTALQEKLNYPFTIADIQLGHGKKNPLGSAYDRAQFLEQRTVMMQDWADYIDSVKAKL